MPVKNKEKKSKERRYSFNEYRKAFCVKTAQEQKLFTADPDDFGQKLAQEALKKVRQDLRQTK